jgi:hypothetical protein
MPAPSKPPSEIVDAIVDHLPSSNYSKSEIAVVVRLELEHLLPWQIAEPPIFGKQAENKKYAKEIDRLTGKLLEKLEEAPKGTANSLYILASRCEPLKWSLYDPYSPAVKHFRQTLLAGLASLRTACSDITAPGNVVGDHHNRDHIKQLCAGCALDLIVGLVAGEPTNSSENSPIRVIAGVLYDAVGPRLKKNGEWSDLKDQCAEVGAHWRGLSEGNKRAHIAKLRLNWGLRE